MPNIDFTKITIQLQWVGKGKTQHHRQQQENKQLESGECVATEAHARQEGKTGNMRCDVQPSQEAL